MKFLLFIAILTIQLSHLYSQSNNRTERFSFVKDNPFQFIIDEEDSTYSNYYENGQIRSKYTVIDGKGEGEYLEYFKNGNLRIKTFYVKGKINGYKFDYFENGNLMAKTYCVDGKIDGTRLQYYNDGKIHRKDSLYKHVLNYSIEYYYFNSGLVKRKITMEYKAHSANKSIIKNINYTRKGVADFDLSREGLEESGTIYIYNRDGTIFSENHYKNGIRHGAEKIYDKKGELVYEVKWVDGKKIK